LEARWAVFFDYLNVKWQYEPCTISAYSGDGTETLYIPDFYLPDAHYVGCDGDNNQGLFVEVKGRFSQSDFSKLETLIDFRASELSQGLLVLGEIPDSHGKTDGLWHHLWLRWQEGVDTEYRYMMISPATKTMRIKAFEWMRIDAPIFGGTDLSPDAKYAYILAVVDNNPQWLSWDYYYATQYQIPIRDAYAAARSARFEHGANGAT